MNEFNIEERKNKAVDLFKSGYNCSQSVFLAYSDLFQIENEMAKTISAPFGGGIGRLREMCGACSGMYMLAGLKYPASNPENKEMKTLNYKAVQFCANSFKEINSSYICAELLQIKREQQQPIPDDRNAAYYAKRPCAKLVADAAVIIGSLLKYGF